MRTRIALLLLLLASVLPGCASRDDVETLQRDMNEMKNRMYQMDRDIGAIRTEAKQGTDSTLKEFQGQVESMRKTMADLQASQDTLRVDIQSLAGKVDDTRLSAQKPGEELSLLKEDLDRRLTTLETKMAGGQQTPPAEVKPDTPEALYQSGLQTFKGGDMKKSRELFTKFLEQHPKSDLAANARFWIGETYYNEKNLEQAILEYQDVIKKFPGKEKTAAAMLKQGMAFQGLGDPKSARFIYKKITEDYPRSDEAKKAKEKLKALK